MKSKGISPVVATVLLAAVIIAVVAGAVLVYIISTSIAADITLGGVFPGSTSITINHEGGDPIPTSDIALMVNDTPIPIEWNGDLTFENESVTVTLTDLLDYLDEVEVVYAPTGQILASETIPYVPPVFIALYIDAEEGATSFFLRHEGGEAIQNPSANLLIMVNGSTDGVVPDRGTMTEFEVGELVSVACPELAEDDVITVVYKPAGQLLVKYTV